MTGPRSPNPTRETRGHTEDILALLGSIQERQKCILLHAYQETGYDPIFDEASSMARELLQTRRIVQKYWCKIQALIDAEE